jgi:hypothetical protein
MEIAFAAPRYVKYAVGKGRSTWLQNVYDFKFQSNVGHCCQLQNIDPLVPNVTDW